MHVYRCPLLFSNGPGSLFICDCEGMKLAREALVDLDVSSYTQQECMEQLTFCHHSEAATQIGHLGMYTLSGKRNIRCAMH